MQSRSPLIDSITEKPRFGFQMHLEPIRVYNLKKTADLKKNVHIIW